MMDSECDHTRGIGRTLSSAITICRCCRDYLCSICGGTIVWYEGLRVTNPIVQWRYCGKPTCLEAEGTYHGHPIDMMAQYRNAVVAKRVLQHLQDRGLAPRPSYTPPEQTILPSGAVRIKLAPHPFTLDPGEACWCNRGKDCDGNHEIGPIEIEHRCGICGQTFQISKDDPHWSTGRGPICPDDRRS